MNNKPRNIIFDLLLEFFSSNKSFKVIIDKSLKNLPELNQTNKNFILNISKGVLRYKTVLDFNISKYSKIKKTDKKTLILLYMGIYQILYCDGIPNYAAVNTIVELSKNKHKKSTTFINAILRKVEKSGFRIDEKSKDKEYIKINFLHPEWLLNKLIDHYGTTETRKILKLNLEIPKIWLRVNLLKTTIKFIKDILGKNNISFIQDTHLKIYLRVNKFDSKGTIIELIKEGYLYIQNPSSGHVINLMDPKKDNVILDACSAPGGKASLLGQLMKNKIKITCMDINDGRMNKLKTNLSILNILNIQYLCSDALTYNSKIHYDKIIMDMPCSSSGTIRKNPDIKWRLNESIIKEFQTTQYKILDNMKNSLKAGGEIVYCTCSIFNDENEYNIIKFLKKNDDFTISNIKNLVPLKFINKIGGITILPNKNDYEGIFAIKLKKHA